MLESLKIEVYKANLDLVKYGLVLLTWGNASGIDRKTGLVVIKPSGIPYDFLRPDELVVLDLEGKVVEGRLNPSSDAPTHIELYKNFKNIGGVVHTHSKWAVAWAQAGIPLPAMGTTHADYFYGAIPCTRRMNEIEVQGKYEVETGSVILEAFKNINPDEVPGVLVHSHGPFTWGKDSNDAVRNSVVLENIAEIAYHTLAINSKVNSMDNYLLDKHFLRKHGQDAYYGQKKK